MVTIRCITYNQEKFIRKCLEGFVMQQTNFRFEAVVHDDASTDGTADIIREFEKKYPDIIKPIYEEENQYSKFDGSLYKAVDSHIKGKYVAICEGDDFWIDPLKLQKQFDYMEQHPDCSLCFHANYQLYPSGKTKIYKPKVIKEKYTAVDAINGRGGFMATNSLFYRWEYLKNGQRPDFWTKCQVGDIPCALFYASKGYLGYIDEVMSVYRVMAEGSWNREHKGNIRKKISFYRSLVKMYNGYDVFTNRKYHKELSQVKRDDLKDLVYVSKNILIKRLKRLFKK